MKFVVELVTLELSVEVTKMNAGNAGVKFWVINAGLDVKDENKYAQKFTLSLKPSIETASTQDESTSLKVVEEIMGTPLGG